jgi:type I restriction enzyme S subunit
MRRGGKDGWETRKLGEIADVQSGGTPLVHNKTYWNGDIAWYSSGELNDLHTSAPERHISRAGLENSNAKLFPAGSLLIGMYDTAALKMSVLDRPAAFNQAIAGVRPNDQIDLVFVLHAINAIKDEILERRRGVRQKNLSLGKIKDIELLMPPLPEQRRIVGILDGAFEGIATAKANAERNLQNARALFESHLNSVFTKRGPGWAEKTVDQISTNLDSRRVPITKGDRKSGKYPYYGASGIVDHVAEYIFEGDALLVSEDGANLLMRSTPIAFSVSGKYWVNNHAHILKFANMPTQRFVEFYLESIRLDEYIRGAAQPKLTQKALNAIPIPIPDSVEAQGEIVRRIEFLSAETQRLSSIYQQKLAALDELKKSLLHQAFSGEL